MSSFLGERRTPGRHRKERAKSRNYKGQMGLQRSKSKKKNTRGLVDKTAGVWLINNKVQ